MAERLKAVVLKTTDPKGSGGSNPSPSARSGGPKGRRPIEVLATGRLDAGLSAPLPDRPALRAGNRESLRDSRFELSSCERGASPPFTLSPRSRGLEPPPGERDRHPAGVVARRPRTVQLNPLSRDRAEVRRTRSFAGAPVAVPRRVQCVVPLLSLIPRRLVGPAVAVTPRVQPAARRALQFG